MDLVPLIFHERQEGQLCAQHALNALLQGPYFTAVDLSSLAQDLDREETAAMAEGGTDSTDFRRFLEGGSSNYDDSGFFSVQVVSRALAVWNLEIRPIRSQDMSEARTNPSAQNAFICNLDQHWFTLRRFGGSPHRWYNLNSVFSGPHYVSETYLSDISPCEADIVAAETPIPSAEAIAEARKSQQSPGKSGIKSSNYPGKRSRQNLSESEMTEDEMMSRAVAMSLGHDVSSVSGSKSNPAELYQTDSFVGADGQANDDDEDIRLAIEASLADEDKRNISLQKVLEQSLAETTSSKPTMNSSFVAPAPTVATNSQQNPEDGLTDLERVRRRRLERFGGI